LTLLKPATLLEREREETPRTLSSGTNTPQGLNGICTLAQEMTSRFSKRFLCFRVRVSGSMFKYIFGQTSVRAKSTRSGVNNLQKMGAFNSIHWMLQQNVARLMTSWF